MALNELGADGGLLDDIVSGQTLVFVGTDPLTLESDIYLVRAVGDGRADVPDLRDAEAFALEPLLTLTESVANGSIKQSDSDQLFPVEAPFVVPDEEGLRVLAAALTRDEEGRVLGGRLAIVDITPRRHRVSPFIPGLISARFTWAGDWLVVQIDDPEDGNRHLQVMRVDDLELDGALRPIGPIDALTDVDFAEPIRDENAFLARALDTRTGIADIYRLDPDLGSSTLLTQHTDLSAAAPRQSADGRMLAVTLQAETTENEEVRRQIGVFDLATDGPPIFIAGDETADCGRPAWSPPQTIASNPILAYACRSLSTGRPDLLLWEAEPNPSLATPPITLTGSAQTAVPGASIDGLVLRAGPLWDPGGTRVVFGASTEEQALDGEGMTILTFPLEDGLPLDRQEPLAYSVYPSGFGSADWLHFSAGSIEPILMLWDRNETGLEDSGGGHPIEVVSVAPDGGPPRPVALGRDLRVSFPVFLGRNTLFYR
jgi:hypothetical protein